MRSASVRDWPAEEPPPPSPAPRGASARVSVKRTPAQLAAIANRRVLSNLNRYLVASRRTLESKIAEAGRGDIRVPPKELGAEIKNMLARGEIVQVATRPPADLFAIPGSPDDEVATRVAAITGLYDTFARFAADTGAIGVAGEQMIRRAFDASPHFHIICPRWGDVFAYNGRTLTQQSDGLVLLADPLHGRPATDGVALVEIKNRREWVYPEDYRLWKLIRNAYTLDVVGLFFARRIYGTTFGYTLKKVGAIGIETFAQFAPADSKTDLESVRAKSGLGFHDIYFREDIPPYLQHRVDTLGPLILRARDRMNQVGEIVRPYLDDLANTVKEQECRDVFERLQEELRDLDYPEQDKSEEFGDDEDHREYEEEMRGDYEDAMRRDYEGEMRRQLGDEQW
jgi:hypothetical protein